MNTKTIERTAKPKTISRRILVKPAVPRAVAAKKPVAVPPTGARTKSSAKAPGRTATKESVSPITAPSGKTAIVTDLIQRPGGASLAELIKATGWQAHSVRGVISAVLRKKQGLAVEIHADADGTRTYCIGATARV